MTYEVDDRIFETSVTTGTGTYTLDGPVTGYQAFSELTANNYCPYFVTMDDSASWEAGIGQVLGSPARLARTHVLASSNSDAAVDWGAGTKNIRCGQIAAFGAPRIKSVSIAGGAGDQTLTQDEQRCDILILTGALTGNRNAIVDATPWAWAAVINNTTGSFSATLKVSGLTGATVAQGGSRNLVCNGTDVVAPRTLPTVSVLAGSGTYTTKAGCTSIRVCLRGGGGGGGAQNTNNGSAGGDTTFGALSAIGGGGGTFAGSQGATGGGASGGDLNYQGGSGGPGQVGSTGGIALAGGRGGGGSGGGAGQQNAGQAGAANTGSGGGGGGGDSATNSGAGGGEGGYCEKTIASPAATYAYAVGAGGAAGAAGGRAGGAGGAGTIVVYENYD